MDEDNGDERLPAPLSCHVGQMARARRILKGRSQRDVANLLGVHPSVVCRMESGKTRIFIRDLKLIASFLGVSVRMLIEGNCPRCGGTPPWMMRCLACGAEATVKP